MSPDSGKRAGENNDNCPEGMKTQARSDTRRRYRDSYRKQGRLLCQCLEQVHADEV